MKKLISLLKAAMSQDMNLFKIKADTKGKNKVLFPIVLSIIMMLAVGSYSGIMAEALKPINQVHIMLALFIIVTTVLTLIEGIYKSQGILFEAKDNDLLFSLPIEKSKILFTRISKLIVFQFFYNTLFMIPAFAVYAYYMNPDISFYLISLLMLFLLPIIPTIISAFLGYIVKAVSVQGGAKKTIQTIVTFIFSIGMFFLAFNLQGLLNNMAENAEGIGNTIGTVYYPVKLYINLIQNFNLLDLLILLTINIVPFILFIYLASIFYFKIISKSNNISISKKKIKSVKDEKNILKRSKNVALIQKELKRFISSPVYIINTLFGVVLLLIITIAMSINFDGVFNILAEGEEIGIEKSQIISFLPKVFYEIITFVACLTSITSAMISIEGNKFNILKSLPVSTTQIVKSKIIASNIISLPLIIISDIIFFIAFNVGLVDVIYILLISFIMPILISIIGLLVNLKFPKMDAANDTEAVKQSLSTTVSVFIGMLIGVTSIILIIIVPTFININTFILIEIVVFTLAIIILWNILKKYAKKRFKQIEI